MSAVLPGQAGGEGSDEEPQRPGQHDAIVHGDNGRDGHGRHA